MMSRLFTFGYEGLSIDAFAARLEIAEVRLVLDVRANPLSRKPGFSKKAFAANLEARGIEYRHFPAMGCPKGVRDRYKADGDWMAYTRGFLAYLSEQSEAVAELAQAATVSSACVVCFEADYKRCHRTYVARAAAKLKNLQVVHLTDRKEFPEAWERSAA